MDIRQGGSRAGSVPLNLKGICRWFDRRNRRVAMRTKYRVAASQSKE